MQPQMNTDRFLSVFICVHLWFRSYFWLRLGCTVEFVANKTDHEFHEFYENDLESLELDYLAQPRECCNNRVRASPLISCEAAMGSGAGMAAFTFVHLF